jgi:hypothetical protein
MDAVRRLVAAILGEPLRLPPALLQTFPELAGARYRHGGLMPRIGGWTLGLRSAAAVTMWRTIFIARGVPLHPELLLHELRHVHQFGASAAFPLSYLWECVRCGYRGNRYEIDARRWASARVRTALAERSPEEE